MVKITISQDRNLDVNMAAEFCRRRKALFIHGIEHLAASSPSPATTAKPGEPQGKSDSAHEPQPSGSPVCVCGGGLEVLSSTYVAPTPDGCDHRGAVLVQQPRARFCDGRHGGRPALRHYRVGNRDGVR